MNRNIYINGIYVRVTPENYLPGKSTRNKQKTNVMLNVMCRFGHGF